MMVPPPPVPAVRSLPPPSVIVAAPPPRPLSPVKPVSERKMRALSASQIATYMDCPRKWAFDKIDRHPRQQHASAALGERVHAILEDWLRHGKPPDRAEEFTYQHGSTLVTRYPGRIAESGLHLLPAPGPHLNVEDELHMRSEKSDWIGYVDLHWLPDPNVRIPTITDHKTTSSISRYALSEDPKSDRFLGDNVQANLYAAWAMWHYGTDLVDLKWVYYSTKATPERAKRVHLRVHKNEIAPRLDQLDQVADEMWKHYRTAESAKDLPPNLTSCEKYGGCQFKNFCLSPSERLSAIMTQNESMTDMFARIAAENAAAGGVVPPAPPGMAAPQAPTAPPAPAHVVAPPPPAAPPPPPAERELTATEKDTIRTWVGQGYRHVDGMVAHLPPVDGQPAPEAQIVAFIAELDAPPPPAAPPPPPAAETPQLPLAAPAQVNPPTAAPIDPGAPPELAPEPPNEQLTDEYEAMDRDRLKAMCVARGLKDDKGNVIDNGSRLREAGLRKVLREADRAEKLAASAPTAPEAPPAAPPAAPPPVAPLAPQTVDPNSPAPVSAQFQVGQRIAGQQTVLPPEANLLPANLALQWILSEGCWVVVEKVASPPPQAPQSPPPAAPSADPKEALLTALTAAHEALWTAIDIIKAG